MAAIRIEDLPQELTPGGMSALAGGATGGWIWITELASKGTDAGGYEVLA